MPYIESVHIHASNPGRTIDFFKDFFGAETRILFSPAL